MPRRKKEDAPITDAPVKKTTRKPRAKKESTAPAAPKPRTKKESTAPAASRPRAKKEVTASDTTPAEKPVRKPRKKKVVPNFVIQNLANNGITYEAVLEKVGAAVQGADVSSLDIYVKAEEGKAYYVVNGEAPGAVELF